MELVKLHTGPVDKKVRLYVNPMLVGIIEQQIGQYKSLVQYGNKAIPCYESPEEARDLVNAQLKLVR